MTIQQLTLDGGTRPLVPDATPTVGAPYVAHSATSKAAAEKIAPKVSRLEGYVLWALTFNKDGLTDHEIDERNTHNIYAGTTLRPRRVALSEWVYKVGKEIVRSKVPRVELVAFLVRRPLVEQTQEKRKTRFGNDAHVHKLTAEGRAVAEQLNG